MSRRFNKVIFNKIYNDQIINGTFNENPAYYPRYRNRYKKIIMEYSKLVGRPPKRIMDIGGGQYGLITKSIWGDNPTVVDIGGNHLNYLEEKGIKTKKWNLVNNEQPFFNEFDVVFFSEVIEHIPIPAYIILEKIKLLLKPGGLLILTTPNFFRLKNVLNMMLGKELISSYFQYPTTKGLGHVFEYSKQHIYWQLKKAGFVNINVTICQFHHNPNNIVHRILSWLGYPLFIIPRFRDNILSTSYTPVE